MKKHYAFIPLKDTDLSSFRKSLIQSMSARPIFAILALLVLAIIGYGRQSTLSKNAAALIVFALSIAWIIYLIFLEAQKLFVVVRLHKSSLMPYIHVRGSDTSFYIEEVSNGFIVQIEPVNLMDISACRHVLGELVMQFAGCSRIAEYLHSCMDSRDDHLINKAVIYVEILQNQLEHGNLDILATYDKLKNYKEELS
jgi:hypothetical protein